MKTYKIWKTKNNTPQITLFKNAPVSHEWYKLEIEPYPDDLTPTGGFMDVLVYRKVYEVVPLDHACVYFLQLGDSDIIKVGRCKVSTQVYHRRIDAQTYFFGKVDLLGVQFCDTPKDANLLENSILDYFTPNRRGIRKNLELVDDRKSLLGLYIQRYCSEPDEVLTAGDIAWREERREKRSQKKRREQLLNALDATP